MKKGILVASFGTTFPKAREKSITAMEKTISSACPEYQTYRAFTSGMVRQRILEREGISIDSVPEALERMRTDGIETVFIQPTHVIPGEEYDKIIAAADRVRGKFSQLKTGQPLLWEENDFVRMADILNEYYHFSDCSKEEAFVLMGHGTRHEANRRYLKLQTALRQRGLSHVLLPTVEGKPDFAQILKLLQKKPYKKVTLLPLMVVAGDHVNNDLFGEDNDSWKNQLLSAGYEVGGQSTGLGEIPAVRELFLSHFQHMLSDTSRKE